MACTYIGGEISVDDGNLGSPGDSARLGLGSCLVVVLLTTAERFVIFVHVSIGQVVTVL